MSTAQKIGKRCRQNPWRQHFFDAARHLAAAWRHLWQIEKMSMVITTYSIIDLAATLAPSWRDHAAKPPHPYRVAATGGILAGGMCCLWITWAGWSLELSQ